MSRRVGVFCTLIAFLGCGCELVGAALDAEDRYPRPVEARRIASDDLLERLIEAGFPVYAGLNPPDITGTYHSVDGQTIYDDNQGGPGSFGTTCEAYLTYMPTNSILRYDTELDYVACEGGSTGLLTYVSGFGNCFTLYSKQAGSFHGCEFTSVSIRSGCLVEDGIEDYILAFLHTEQRGAACADLIDVHRISGVDEVRMVEEAFLARVD